MPPPANWPDIRDTVDYKGLMKKYQLGPNGAILTALNLFTTKFDQVLDLLKKRSDGLDYVLVDTPGQIEAFNWSASGTLTLDALSMSFPTVVCYLIDTPRCQHPTTFMANMLYACSILYKSRLPFVCAFNKIDVQSNALCVKWMTDYDSFLEALTAEESYASSLSRSAALTMCNLYENIGTVGVSASTLAGLGELEEAFIAGAKEHKEVYLTWLNEQRARVQERSDAAAASPSPFPRMRAGGRGGANDQPGDGGDDDDDDEGDSN
eukprot:GHVU01113028.1.p1 GENE.GHVU01113028.1~~GHVU01113028.1.p1  ORF type:complete len:265 (+),score=56.58 GHVU01113028.1:805-1599(+)